jgi:hypothetical protein
MKKMRLTSLFTLILILQCAILFSQSAPITIDGQFNDWTENLAGYIDPLETVSEVDLLEFQVTNDDQFLFLKIVLDTELNLKEDDPIDHSIFLYIDTDNNAQTGFSVQEGFGSEVGINFSNLSVNFDADPASTVYFSDIKFRMGPTITSTQFEIAIGRDAVPDYINDLFTSPEIKILFKNWDNGDVMPNDGEVFSYIFDETPVTPFEPVTLEKDNPDFIRVVAYNTLFDGLLESDRIGHFESVLKALNPDIIGFSECYDTYATTVEDFLNSWLPLGTTEGWHVVKKGDLITASRWPIIQTWSFITRSYPVLIDLPDNYASDLLYTVSHLSCCANNSGRQKQIDEYVEFMLQMKTNGSSVGFVENTPFIFSGDLNLVGYAQQLTTLLNGDIQNINQFGQGGPLDWDNSELTDQICLQTDQRMSYTWRNDFSSYPPGRLDFIIYSDAVMTSEKSFTLQTEVMPEERLMLYGLNSNDTGSASDHFPVVTDFSIDVTDAVAETEIQPFNIFPNPTNDKLTIELDKGFSGTLILVDALGRELQKIMSVSGSTILNTAGLENGIYFVIMENNKGVTSRVKFVKD